MELLQHQKITVEVNKEEWLKGRSPQDKNEKNNP